MPQINAATVRRAHWMGAILLTACSAATADTLILKNGMTVRGKTAAVSSIGEDALAPAASGNVDLDLIVLVDDGLTRTFVSKYQVVDMPPAVDVSEIIRLKQKVQITGESRIGNIGAIVGVTPFDDWGRRIFSVLTPKGRADIVQGITEITPTWTRVQGLLSKKPYVWDMRIATSSIPRDKLRTVIFKHHKEEDADVWLSLVRLYLQSERYAYAEEELQAAIQKFPNLAEFKQQLKELRQLRAQQQIDEMKLRRDAGQHRLVASLLGQFPDENVAGEILLQVSEMADAYTQQAEQGANILQSIAKQLLSVKSAAHRLTIQAFLDELTAELNFNTLPRLADYIRLLPDPELDDENKIAFAVSGWLLGGNGIENLSVATSLWKVREIINEYLTSKDVTVRERLLAELTSLEGGSPAYVAKILAAMKPPLATEGLHDRIQPTLTDDGAAPSASETDGHAATEGIGSSAGSNGDSPAAGSSQLGPLTITTDGIRVGSKLTYVVQLPPEYDANRSYPTIVTLHATGSNPKMQVDWWAGSQDPQLGMRRGQAGRQGYIVIAPAWSRPRQNRYEYSAVEHAAVLFALRDACQRFSIDTDQVFLSGHSMGGDAAWDIGLSHPDLWAGVIPIGAVAEYSGTDSPKYVSRYWKNGRLVPLYFVSGALDAEKLDANSRDHNRYLKTTGFDTMVVEYRGRGDEHFQDEIQRLFRWMSYHRRDLAPREFSAQTMRPWDNFFYWVEVDGIPGGSVILPTEWPARGRPTVIEGKVREKRNIILDVGTQSATVWLSPQLVDLDADVTLHLRSKKKKLDTKPDVAVILEDARQRGDRVHPFWAKYEVTTGRGRR